MLSSPNMQPTAKKIFEIKSQPDPTGMTRHVGHAPGFDLSAGKQCAILHYKSRRHGGEFFLTADIYAVPGAPIYVVVFCPLCQNTLRITADNKKLEWEPDVAPRFAGYRTEEVLAQLNTPELGGSLSVEPFGCAWEVEPGLQRKYGFAICPWRVAIDRNVVKDA